MLGQNQNNSGENFWLDEREEIDGERRALRALRDSFHNETETLLEKTLDHPATRRKIGKFIGGVFIKPYIGEK